MPSAMLAPPPNCMWCLLRDNQVYLDGVLSKISQSLLKLIVLLSLLLRFCSYGLT